VTERGKNRETMFAEWWETKGRVICWNITQRKLSQQMMVRELAKFGYIWGWIDRQAREQAQKRRAKRNKA